MFFWKKKETPRHPLWVIIPVIYNVIFTLIFLWAWLAEPIPRAHEYLVALPVILFPFLDQAIPSLFPVGQGWIIVFYFLTTIVFNALGGACIVLLAQKISK
ncbi:MAG TPA: hypothetical protein VIT68_01940 [Candidatus Gracilibacteria bacterium]